MVKKLGKISECEKQDDCWTNIASPDFVPRQRLRGYLVSPGHGSLDLTGVKKNGLRLLWGGPAEFLRSKGAAGQGFALRGKANLSGGVGAAGSVPPVRESEARETAVAGGQHLLHQALRFFCGTEMPVNDGSGRCQRSALGLEDRQGDGHVVYGGTVATGEESAAGDYRDRRNIDQEGTRISNRSQRPDSRLADLVRWEGPLRGEHGWILPVVGAEAEREYSAGGHGYVEGVRELGTEERAGRGHPL